MKLALLVTVLADMSEYPAHGHFVDRFIESVGEKRSSAFNRTDYSIPRFSQMMEEGWHMLT